MLPMLAAFVLAAPVPKPTPDWVTVKGAIVWPEKEKIPETKVYDVPPKMHDAGYANRGGPLIDDKFLVDEKSRGLKNVVVWFRPDSGDPKASFPAEKIHPDLVKAKPVTHTLTNEFCRFDKRVLAVRVGDKLEVVNKSPVPCNFKWDEADSGGCNVLLKPNDKSFVTAALTTPGMGFFTDCIHCWVGKEEKPFDGRVRAIDNPYFAVTNEDGEFEIKQVPKGKWRIMYWHESGFHKGKDGRLGYPIEVEGNKQGEMTLKALAFEVPQK